VVSDTADVKWIKIVTDIFDDDKILLIESMPDADAIIVIWFKLLCLAGKQNNSGVFLLNGRIAYTDEMFATIFRRPLNTVRMALKTFEQFGMIEIINDTVTIPNWEKHQKLDALEASREATKTRVARYREKQKLLADSCNVTGNVTVTDSNADREEKNREDKSREEESIENTKRKRFVKPTLDEVSAYALEIDYNLNSEAFMDYYDANGWKIGGKSSMKDWKAAVRQWKRHDQQKGIDTHAKHREPDPVELTDEESRLIDEIYARNGRDAFM
jgi:predicted phage replisome organizer